MRDSILVIQVVKKLRVLPTKNRHFPNWTFPEKYVIYGMIWKSFHIWSLTEVLLKPSNGKYFVLHDYTTQRLLYSNQIAHNLSISTIGVNILLTLQLTKLSNCNKILAVNTIYSFRTKKKYEYSIIYSYVEKLVLKNKISWLLTTL